MNSADDYWMVYHAQLPHFGEVTLMLSHQQSGQGASERLHNSEAHKKAVLLMRNAEAHKKEAKWHVRVSKQSCKQTNLLILWGCWSTKIYFFS